MSSIAVEVRDKHGVRLERLNRPHDVLTIGRDWSNDVVLLDDYIDAEHLQISIDDDGLVLLHDCESTNGSFLKGKRFASNQTYNWGEGISLGDTELRLFATDQAVAQTRQRSAWFRWAHAWSSTSSLAAAGVLALIFYLLDAYLSATKPIKLQALAFESWPIIVSLLLITVFFGVLAKLFRGESNFSALWLLVCYSLILSIVLELLLSMARFNIQNFHLGRLVQASVTGVFIFIAALGLFSFIFQLRERSRWMVSGVTAMLVVSLMLGTNLFKEDRELWRASTQTEQATLPPAFLLRPSRSLADYQTEASTLFDKIDAQNGVGD